MNYEKERFLEIVNISKTLSDVARYLNIEPSKGNRDTIKKYINLYKINTDHFQYFSGNNKNFNKKDIEEILVENSSYSTTHLKNRLYKENLKSSICEKCGQDECWNGEKISLILDHKNGINSDNRIENLRILCPNCNATLDTHCSKNKTKYREYIIGLEHNCEDCGKNVSKQSKRCLDCDHLRQRKVERPSIDILMEDVKQMGYVKTGKKYGVSDNSIRKWINIKKINIGK